jgi:tripartite-type tricarboxylate transporter receptor subunit TctC
MTLIRTVFATILALGLQLASAHAQEFPQRPIRLVIPYPAGGTTDIIARALQEPLRASLGQPIVVENRGGGAGTIGIRAVMNAPPDGYSLVISNNGPTTLLPLLQPDVGYGPVGAMAPISLLSIAPLILTVSTNLPTANLQEFFDYARTYPSRLFYGTAGVGSFGHVATLLMNQMAGIQAEHIPYRGQAPMTLALISGEVQFVLTTYSHAMDEQVKAGKLRRLGVSTAEASPVVPGVPPIGTALPGFAAEVWFGLLAPNGTPPAVVTQLNGAVRQVLALPAVQRQLRSVGMVAQASSPEEFAQRLQRDVELWQGIVRSADIKPE